MSASIRESPAPLLGDKESVAAAQILLEQVRERTLLLVRSLSEEDSRTQQDALMSPIVWDLGHIAAFEELWLQQHLERDIEFGEMPGLYNPFEHPRSQRGSLPLPSLAEALSELERIRSATVQRLRKQPADARSRLLRHGYVFRMVAQHESQHQETILQTLQLKRGTPYRAPRAWDVPAPSSTSAAGRMARFPGGEVTIGTDDTSAAYDNERPTHTVVLQPFEIDRAAVTNGDYAAFMDAGGYDDIRLWSEPGLEWLRSSGAQAPRHWKRQAGVWTERMMDREREVDPHRPVCHVCYHEAEAFARWAGKRLPTEYEWEVAATWHPVEARRAYPWGNEPPDRTRANLDQLAFDTAPIGAYPTNVSPLGCYGLIGDAWEWTSSDFRPYPGFRSFPYREYSEPFFGTEYKVLRGGSWATAPHVARVTFRNWDFPVRRQIFAGFRCARDA